MSESMHEAPGILTFFVGIGFAAILIGAAVTYWWISVPLVALLLVWGTSKRRRRRRNGFGNHTQS